MPLNIKDGTVIDGCRIRLLRRWTRRGHAVFHVSLENRTAGVADRHLLCECDFETVWTDGRARLAWRRKQRGSECRAKASVAIDTFHELTKSHGRSWRGIGTEDAILDLARRFRDGQYLGQRLASSLTVLEAAALLQVPAPEAWGACRRLASQKKIILSAGQFEIR